MECHRTNDHKAYPVFYDVEPSAVRKQSGEVAEAFAKYENEVTAGKWREALKEAANLAGWELKNIANGHESEFIKKIVEELSLEVRSISFNIDEKLVGMETRIKDVESCLGTGLDDVRMMGIKGIRGSGKTTLARAVFDHISFRFEGRSFVENVREVSNASLFGLKSLQNQVLLDVLNDKNISVNSVSDGKYMMKRRMRDKKVLVALDDVDHIDQLEALAGELGWFMPGSGIIITTRDEQVLIAHGVKFIHDVNLLSDEEAICLFNRYAFRRKIPVQEYEELSRKVVHYAVGLPLTIRVLGSFLCGKDELECIDSIKLLKTIPLKETLKKLELSYIALEKDYKEMFLDVACVMKGWRKDDAIKALECGGFHARNGLKVLEQKSLITIYDNSDNYKYVGMHDHIEEMGWNNVRLLHPDKPHRHTRLWIYEEIENVLANDLGTKATKCIQLDTQIRNRKFDIKGLRKTKELRFLSVEAARNRYWESNIVNPEFPDALRFLRLQYYPCKSLPISFQANNLVALQMDGSEIIQLWEGGEIKVLNKLRILDLSCSMLNTLDLRVTPNLEKLHLGECSNLVDLHMPTRCLNLIYIDLRGSRLIRTLDLRLAPNLKDLILEFCRGLEKLKMADRCPNLISLILANSKLRTLDIGLYPNLRELDLGNCHYLEDLNMMYECQKLANLNISHSRLRTLNLGLTPNLETLNLGLCCHLEELHMPIAFLKLKYVNLGGASLKTLDLGLAPNLEYLHLDECNNLEKLRMPSRSLNLQSLQLTNSKLRTLDIGQTPNLSILDLKKNKYLEELDMADECQMLANLDISHSKLRTLDLSLSPNLETLHLNECYNLVELLPPTGGLKKLVNLYLRALGFSSFSFQIKHHTSSSVDESLEIGPLAELNLTAKSLDSCPLHPNNSLPKLNFSCHYEEDRPSMTRNIEMLISLGMCACTNLETFLECIYGLRRLRKLELGGNILEVPKDLGQLECLEELILSSTEIKHLPDSICMLKNLKFLKLNGCSLLEKLPEELGRLECLKWLNIEGTCISHLPKSILLLKGMCIGGSRELLELCGFTSEIQTSEYHDMYCYVEVG